MNWVLVLSLPFKVCVCLAGSTGFAAVFSRKSYANRKYVLYVLLGVAWARTVRKRIRSNKLVPYLFKIVTLLLQFSDVDI